MDLILFILSIILCFILYYLISSIQSLIKEMKEVKNKCISTQNSKIEDFNVQTPDPTDLMKKKAYDTFNNIKYILGDK